MKSTMMEVFDAIKGEREYQERRWSSVTTGGLPGERSVDEYALYISVYGIKLAEEITQRGHSTQALHIVRKIAALGVACMEQHGAPLR